MKTELIPTTKLVRVFLAALTRVEYSEVIEVPADLTGEQLDELVNQRYRDVDGGKYVNDPEYWERSGATRYEATEGSDFFHDSADMKVISVSKGATPEFTVVDA